MKRDHAKTLLGLLGECCDCCECEGAAETETSAPVRPPPVGADRAFSQPSSMPFRHRASLDEPFVPPPLNAWDTSQRPFTGHLPSSLNEGIFQGEVGQWPLSPSTPFVSADGGVGRAMDEYDHRTPLARRYARWTQTTRHLPTQTELAPVQFTFIPNGDLWATYLTSEFQDQTFTAGPASIVLSGQLIPLFQGEVSTVNMTISPIATDGLPNLATLHGPYEVTASSVLNTAYNPQPYPRWQVMGVSRSAGVWKSLNSWADLAALLGTPTLHQGVLVGPQGHGTLDRVWDDIGTDWEHPVDVRPPAETIPDAATIITAALRRDDQAQPLPVLYEQEFWAVFNMSGYSQTGTPFPQAEPGRRPYWQRFSVLSYGAEWGEFLLISKGGSVDISEEEEINWKNAFRAPFPPNIEEGPNMNSALDLSAVQQAAPFIRSVQDATGMQDYRLFGVAPPWLFAVRRVRQIANLIQFNPMRLPDELPRPLGALNRFLSRDGQITVVGPPNANHADLSDATLTAWGQTFAGGTWTALRDRPERRQDGTWNFERVIVLHENGGDVSVLRAAGAEVIPRAQFETEVLRCEQGQFRRFGAGGAGFHSWPPAVAWAWCETQPALPNEPEAGQFRGLVAHEGWRDARRMRRLPEMQGWPVIWFWPTRPRKRPRTDPATAPRPPGGLTLADVAASEDSLAGLKRAYGPFWLPRRIDGHATTFRRPGAPEWGWSEQRDFKGVLSADKPHVVEFAEVSRGGGDGQ